MIHVSGHLPEVYFDEEEQRFSFREESDDKFVQNCLGVITRARFVYWYDATNLPTAMRVTAGIVREGESTLDVAEFLINDGARYDMSEDAIALLGMVAIYKHDQLQQAG